MHEWAERLWDGRFTPTVPVVTTLHVPAHHSGIHTFRQLNPRAKGLSRSLGWVAISEYQRKQYRGLVPVTGTVRHGIDLSNHHWEPESRPDAYLFSIGRITSDKGQDTAIAVARKTGRTLVIAGCVQNKPNDRAYFLKLQSSFDLVADLSQAPVTQDYFERVMKPLLDSGKQVIYVGELQAEAAKFWYRQAAATLFPIRWGEPFGMVLIESMASGTPVLAFAEGAVPEIIRDEITGIVVRSEDEMVASVSRIPEIDRRAVRAHVEAHFSLQSMAAGYEAVYRQLMRTRPAVALAPPFTAVPAVARPSASSGGRVTRPLRTVVPPVGRR